MSLSSGGLRIFTKKQILCWTLYCSKCHYISFLCWTSELHQVCQEKSMLEDSRIHFFWSANWDYNILWTSLYFHTHYITVFITQKEPQQDVSVKIEFISFSHGKPLDWNCNTMAIKIISLINFMIYIYL